jgi:chromosome segregation ATPase
MNNSLLEHLRGLEEASLLAQREAASSNDKIKKLTRANDDLTAEMAETKRKLKIAQEIVESSSSRIKTSQRDTTTLRCDLEATATALKAAQEALAATTDEKNLLMRALRDCQNELATAKAEKDSQSVQASATIDATKAAHADTKSMLADMINRLGPLDNENKELRLHLEEVTALVQSYKAKLTTEVTEHAADTKRLKEVLSVLIYRETRAHTLC